MTKQHYQNCQAFISEGQGTYRANRLLTEEDICGIAKTLISAKFLHYSVCFNAVEIAKNYFILHLGHYEQEVFSVAYLDNQNRLIACKEMFYGTIHTTVIHAREIAKCALTYNAAAVLLAHNHPSGTTDPSGSDKEATRKLKTALALIDVKVFDHIIVGGSEALSFSEQGLLKAPALIDLKSLP